MILPREFYARPTVLVARDLLGKILVHGTTSGRIVETEAYLGRDENGRVDLAAHSAAGITDRTRVIFGPPGHAYVYLSYGIHECLNVVAERDGIPGCVLIRALEPVDGLDLMRERRPKARTTRDLTSGPGKLTLALGISRRHYAADLTAGDLVIRHPDTAEFVEVSISPRIGVSTCVDWPLRFYIPKNSFVSTARNLYNLIL